jgi:hypothetical protein
MSETKPSRKPPSDKKEDEMPEFLDLLLRRPASPK